MKGQETHKLSHEGKETFRGTADDCWIKLLKSQGQSTHYAQKYGGWKIEEINTL